MVKPARKLIKPPTISLVENIAKIWVSLASQTSMAVIPIHVWGSLKNVPRAPATSFFLAIVIS
jgi:hypothetical protein